MARIMLKDFDAAVARARDGAARAGGVVRVCAGSGCAAANGFDLHDTMADAIRTAGLADKWRVERTGCHGACAQGPIAVVEPGGVMYEKIKAADCAQIVKSHLVDGKPLERLLHRDPVAKTVQPTAKENPFFARQTRRVLRNAGVVDPERLDSALASGAYAALARTLAAGDREAVLRQIEEAGLRGRGGAGFPTAKKWHAALDSARESGKGILLVVNAGAFMDKSLLEADPHAVIEGILLGAFALQAKEGFLYIRKEYPLARARVEKALTDARDAGLLGGNILGTGLSFDLTVRRSMGAFVSGESSAVIEHLSGRAGEPHARHIPHAEAGFRGQPTVVSNIETWTQVARIVESGAKGWAQVGTAAAKGTKLFNLGGKVAVPGLVEMPFGATLRQIIFEVGGGVPDRRKFKAAQVGGPSGGILPESCLDLPLDYESLAAAGTIVGSGGIVVLDDRTCVVDMARTFTEYLADESCGKCTPCREGLHAARAILGRICAGEGREGDLELLEELAETMNDASFCDLGGTAGNPVLTGLRYFRDEFVAHLRDRKCPAGVCRKLVQHRINPEKCTGCTACVKPCPTAAIAGEVKRPHAIERAKCIECGTCRTVCRFDAVEV